MKQFNLMCGVFSASACLAVLMWLAFPGGKFDFVVGIFGFISVFVLNITSDSMKRYDSSVISEIFFNPIIWLFLSFLNIILMLGGLFLFIIGDEIVLVLQTPFLVFAAMVIMPTLVWFIAISKLTPKSGTMVVDEDDLYYLPGEVLPRLSAKARIITPEMEILVSVSDFSEKLGIRFKVVTFQSFCFAPWVFAEGMRTHLPGSMNYSTNVKAAEKAFFDARCEGTGRPMRTNEDSPFWWNDDFTVVMAQHKA